MKALERIAIVLGVVAFLALVGGCIRWEWNECRKVGHGVLYCIVKAGK